MHNFAILLFTWALSLLHQQPAPQSGISFERIQLSREFHGEGASFADLNRDGHADIVSGPYWYEGPNWSVRHELYTPISFDPAGYSDHFFVWPHDLDGDGFQDLVMVGFPGKEAWWLRNPGNAAKPHPHWEKFIIWHNIDNESPAFTDLSDDGRPGIVCQSEGRFGYLTPDANPRSRWVFHPISDNLQLHTYTHGLGVGDVNGDGRKDLLWKGGWFEQPQDNAGATTWKHHAFEFTDREGGAQMYTYDVDGDGDADIITSLAAHHFGLSWFEQIKENNRATFREHRIMDSRPEDNPFGVKFGELHALDFQDVDGDNVPDIIVGKRWWSHAAAGDPERGAPPVVYWFKLARDKDGARFIPFLADNESGVGVQVVSGDVTRDGLRDIIIGNKRGTFVLKQVRGGPREKPVQDDHSVTLDFEKGDLRGWTSTGTAFTNQPVEGDTVVRRGREASLHEGRFWIGGYERIGDDGTGTLTSGWIDAAGPWASFLVGGGGWKETRVEILDAGEKIIFKTSGADFESMQRVAVDLTGQKGKKIKIRLVDERKGHWGHINFDDFKFHDEQPVITKPAGVPAILPFDEVAHAGLPPADACAAMTTLPGFTVDLIASEPEINQPVAFTIDSKNRIWILEGNTYPNRAPGDVGNDNIIVLEDTDADGRYEKRTVFIKQLNLASGLEVGFGGVFVGAAPYLLFIPDADDDLKPDGPAFVLLDGFGYQDTHETLNGFNWGPDGWLYGCHGVFTHSRVGKPGTPDAARIPMNAAVWRYHPVRKVFEVFAEGTSNPWGVDFNDFGQAFITACVVPHLYHVIQGARYERQAGSSFNPYTFDTIRTIADHVHWLGDDQWAANSRSNSAGGGHAHCGAMIYLGDSFPDSFRNQIFFHNIHGNRINQDLLERRGSGFVGKHGPDLLLANDKWFRGIALKYGPEGSVYFIDWYDKQACHWTDNKVWDRSNGRLYRVSFGTHRPLRVDLKSMSTDQLLPLASHRNDWFVRHSRRILQERGPDGAAAASLLQQLNACKTQEESLRVLWALHGIDALTEIIALAQLKSPFEYVRAWTIQLWLERNTPTGAIYNTIHRLAIEDPSPVVRLYLAAALQRIPLESRWGIAEMLANHTGDANDHNIPRMLWYGIEPLVAADPTRALGMFTNKSIPLVAGFVTRRCAAVPALHAPLFAWLSRLEDSALLPVALPNVAAGIGDQRRLPVPPGFVDFKKKFFNSNTEEVKSAFERIDRAFVFKSTFEELLPIAQNTTLTVVERENALQRITATRSPVAGSTIASFIMDPVMRGAGIRSAELLDDPRCTEAILAIYKLLSSDERRDALNTLSARATSALALLDALENGSIPRSDVGAIIATKMAGLKDVKVGERLAKVWGDVKSTSEEKKQKIEMVRKALSAPGTPDVARGRAVFARTCQQCHTLFGAGGNVGPDLTGSNRNNLDYLLSNVVDPNAVVGQDYRATIAWMKDGRVVSGIQRGATPSSITLQTGVDGVVISRDEIEETRLSEVSTMPEGLFDALSATDQRDLIAYVQSPNQTPLLATPDNLHLIFNKRDLSGWSGNPGVWRVEDGEIVGMTTGLARNEFLISELELSDFILTLEVRLAGDEGNSGIQFRSRAVGDREVAGYQADVGPGWWGKLYEEHGRAVLSDRSGEPFVKKDGWNRYKIEARGSKIRTWINDRPCVDLDDPAGARRGVIAFQVHSGGPTEIRFRNIQLTWIEK